MENMTHVQMPEENKDMQELWTAGNVAQVQMPEENKDTCWNYGLLAMWRKFRCLRRTKTMQELWTASNVAQVQMPEENKDTCRNLDCWQCGTSSDA
jgi:hypothetical protein